MRLFIILVFLLAGSVLWVTLKQPKNSNVTVDANEDVVRKDFKEIVQELNDPTHMLDSVVITPSSIRPESISQSKFGGDPYWPLGKKFPQDPDGKDLFMIAQINLSELPSQNLLPKVGILQFFIASDDLWGLEFSSDERTQQQIIDTSKGYRVIYHSIVIDDVKKLRHEFSKLDQDTYLPINGVYSLSFKIERQHPSATDTRFDRIIGGSVYDFSDEDGEALFEKFNSSGSRIGGYAYFTQQDPRPYGDEKDDWTLLFQMDTANEEGVDIMWGDVGVANFFIRPDDLKNRDFSKVWYNWDCH